MLSLPNQALYKKVLYVRSIKMKSSVRYLSKDRGEMVCCGLRDDDDISRMKDARGDESDISDRVTMLERREHPNSRNWSCLSLYAMTLDNSGESLVCYRLQ